MKRTTKTVTSIAALVGAALVIATPTPANATGQHLRSVCLAIDDEPLCDVVRPASTGGGGGGTNPTVVPTPGGGTDASSSCVRIGHVQACAA